MRELRVEDALLYLDQVKVEFGDRPHIYNEFLDIMKTFKTQQIDTPGVIRRVSNLFQGNRRLVLGFNTFLPEGYKIELPENGDGPPVAVYRTPHSDQAYAVTGPNAGRPAGTQPFASPGNGTGAYPGGSMDSKPAARPLGQPSLAGPGAIPPGQRGTLGQSQAGGGFVGGQPAAMPPRGMNQPGHSMAGLGPHSQPPMQPSQAAAAPAAGPPPGTQAPMEFDHAINYVTTIKKRFSNEPETYKKFLEILHTYQKEQRGIKEVLDEVSVLFSEHPDLLKEFTYFLPDAVQAQAKAQLDAVAKESEERQRARLANQQIMQQAQGVQNRAMPQGSPQNSIPMMSPRPSPPKRAPIPFGATQARSEEMEKEISRSAVYGDVSFDPVRPPLIGAPTVAQAVAKGTRPSVLPRLPPQPTTAETAFFEKAKRHLLRRELAAERTHGPRRNTPYAEFLKCLHMFGAGILSKDELILLLRGLFMQGHAPKSGLTASGAAIHADVASDAHDLLRELEEILIGRGPYARQEMLFKDKSKYGATPSCEFEMKDGEERPTPSYVTYPPDYPSSLFFNNSGQTDGDTAVLNESLACVGDENKSRSIEDSDAVAKRRNAYEQALFRIEDERFEVDMAIERNAHAMRQIEPIAEEVKNLRDRDEKDGMPIGRLQYKLKSRSLNSIHINAIGRIYGDSGDEVIEHLARNPLAVLPIVYQRLRQKDQEWRKQRSELLAKWKKGNEDNYEGSRDFLGHKARKDLERGFTTEQLHRELKEAKKCYAKPQEFMNSPVDFGLSNFDTAAVLYQPYCVIDMKPKSSVHYHAVKLVIRLMKSMNLEPAEREKVGRIWAEFMLPFYEYPANWVADEVRESFRGKISNNVVKFAAGQRVVTAFGEGTILTFLEKDSTKGDRYRVKFPYGVGFLNPSAIMHAITAENAKYVRVAGEMKKDEEFSAAPTIDSAAKVHESYKLLFGTDRVYVFMRLYGYIVALLDDIASHMEKDPNRLDPSLSYYDPMKSDDAKKSLPKLNFASFIASLNLAVAKKITLKEFEAFCRRLSSDRIPRMAALPKLLEKTCDALAKVAEEDLLLPLYDYCQYRGVDPIQLRTQCLTVSSEASCRIQYNDSNGRLYFSYLPQEEDLLTVPVSDDEDDEAMDDDEDDLNSDGNVDDDDDEPMNIDDEDEDIRVIKRQKFN